MEANLDSQVSHPFAFWDPLESHLSAPLPIFVSFASPNRGRFVPIYFCSGRFAKNVQDFLGPFHVAMRALQIERCVVREGLVRDFSSSWEGQTFHLEMMVV